MPDLSPAEARARAALRTARQRAGMSQDALARALGWTQTVVSRIESGTRRVNIAEVEAWMDATQASAADRDELVTALNEAAIRALTWRRLYDTAGGESARQHDYEELERAATRIVVFQPAIVPGLAQTPEYMRRVLDLFGIPPAEIPGMIAGRLQRQRILHEAGRDITFLVTDAALRLRVGPVGVLIEQVDHLISLLDRSTVTVGIIPPDIAVPSLPLSGYELLADVNGEDIVLAEVLAGEVDTRSRDAIGRYVTDVTAWVKVAALGDAARRELARIRADLT